MRLQVSLAFAGLFGGLLMAAAAQPQANATYAPVAPILAQRCVMCHSGPAAPLELRLDTLEGVLKGSAKGPVVKAGSPDDSELIRRLRGTSLPRMPMTGPPFLSNDEIATFERWIAGGLQAGTTAAAETPPAVVTPPRPQPGDKVTYLHVAPIFASRCAKCHTESGLMGPAPEGYRLTSYESTLSAAERVRVVPGKPDASELVRRIRGQARPRMPFDGPPFLTADEIRLIEEWIAQGARNAEGVTAPVPAGARVRLHGRLEPSNRLDGLVLDIGPGTRVDKNPTPGDYVEVRGRLDDSGCVIVERLRPR
jgi:mono/diheme cytochrome c family protein